MRKIAIISAEPPNSFYAGSMQLLRVFQEYPTTKLVALGSDLPLGARFLDCPYRKIALPCDVLRTTRLHIFLMSTALISRSLRRNPDYVFQKLFGFEPDAVFTVMDNFSYYFTAYEFAKKNGIPLITMTMDEPDSFEKIFSQLKGLQHRRIAEVYGYAERNLCVSHQMTFHIAKKYDCATEPFYFGPPDGVSPRPAAEAGRLCRDGKLVLGFAGSLSYGYGEALERICRFLLGSTAIVRIYSRDKPRWSAPNMEYGGCLPSEELWVQFKNECDASLLVYHFDYPESRLYQTHFPTKLSEYAWLGMPMVMAGPSHATGIIWGLEHPGACAVVTQADLEPMQMRLREILESAELRIQMAKAAADAAQNEFDPKKIRFRFHQILSKEA